MYSGGEKPHEPELPGLDVVVPPGLPFGRGLGLFVDHDSQRCAIFLGGIALFQWRGGDQASQRLVIAQLVNAKLAKGREVARVFQVHRNTVARIAQQVAADGVEATIGRKPGPRSSRTVTPAVLAVVQECVAAGKTAAATQQELQRRGVALSIRHISRFMRRLKQEAVAQLELVSDEKADDEAAEAGWEDPTAGLGEQEGGPRDDESAAGEAGMSLVLAASLPDRPGTSVSSRYLGLSLFYPALQAVGLLAMAEQLYQLPGLLRYGVLEVFLHLYCLAILQQPTIERVKRLLTGDLGVVVMGGWRAACVKTLRRKLATLVQQRHAVQLGRLLARHWVEGSLISNTHVLFVDGHVKLYCGKREVPEVFNSVRRIVLPGIETYFVNDLQGRPLLAVSEGVTGNLAKSLPAVVAAVRDVLREQRFTLIFDRGGFDTKLFTWLVDQQLDFITYQSGQSGEVNLPDADFHWHEVRWEGKRVRFKLAKDMVQIQDTGPWRRVVLKVKNKQIPILTSLGAEAIGPARVTALIQARWRQENFFKYARAHLGLDVLTSYASQTAADHEVPNPEFKAAKATVDHLRATATKLKAALGKLVSRAASAVPTQDDPTPAATRKRRSAKTAATQADLLTKLQAVETELEQARTTLKALPKRVLLSSLGPLPQVPQLEAKVLADTVKLAAYNAQAWLEERLAHHYARTDDRFDLLRSFAELPGTMTRRADGSLLMCLEPPSIPLCCRALEGLCQELNLVNPTFPGTGTPLRYEVAMHCFTPARLTSQCPMF